MADLDLNVFTNFCVDRVEALPLWETLKSVEAAFGLDSFSHFRIFCHAAPRRIAFDALSAALVAALPGRAVELYSTRSLVDGYIRSLTISKAPTVFQLEHDWRFEGKQIQHSPADIVRAMHLSAIPYLRFNMLPNYDNDLDRVSPLDMAGIPICKTIIFSNHPHLIDRSYALANYVPRMNRTSQGSRGIEKQLTAAFHAGWIYGPIGHPPVIVHSDGKATLRAWRRERLSHRASELVTRCWGLFRDRFGLGHYGRIY